MVPLKCLANPEERFVPVYGDRRIYAPSLSGRLPGAEHAILPLISWRKWQPGSNAAAYRWNACKQTMVLSLPTVSPTVQKDLPTQFELAAARLGIRHKLIRPYTPRPQREGGTQPLARIRSGSTIRTASSLLPILVCSSLHTKIAPTTCPCALFPGSLPEKNLPLPSFLSLSNMFEQTYIRSVRDFFFADVFAEYTILPV